MTTALESYVYARFDNLEARFKAELVEDDFRWNGLKPLFDFSTSPRLLDLGCGKGRFARRLQDVGARVIGLDPAAKMLAHAVAIERVQSTGRRLPFASEAFDGVVAVEVFEHLPSRSMNDTLDEIYRILRPGGLLAIIDKNALSRDAQRPWLPSLALKWLDEYRGRWMYPRNAPFRERWFLPDRFRKKLEGRFGSAQVGFLPRPEEEAHHLFESHPANRLFALWTARKAGGGA